MRYGDRVFADRAAAGQALAAELARSMPGAPLVILGLPRGGVPVAFPIAEALGAPLDVMVVRKVGMPGQPELAIGAVASGGVTVREPSAAAYAAGVEPAFERLAAKERIELERRERTYRGGLPPLELTGQHVILVDDGLATGSTMLAAVRAARQGGAASVTVAAPVASREAAALVGAEADALALLQTPAALFSIGEWYENFEQLEDEEVCRLLKENREHGARRD
jgi:predicted phosphoribosyltransferase